MAFHCPTKSLCVDPSTPFANFTAEAPDKPIFLGYNFGYGPALPPLGSDFTSPGCAVVCESTVGQEDADLCAARNWTDCTSIAWPVGTPTVDVFGNPAVTESPRPVFSSQAESATVNCPDGLLFTYTVKSGLFKAYSQAQANAMAQSWAQEQAPMFQLCLSALSPSTTCVNAPYAASITASGVQLAKQTACWSILGALPSGITSDLDSSASCITGSNTLHFQGTPDTPGMYTFFVKAVDNQGDVMSKKYLLIVAGITNPDLTEGTVGVAYNQDLFSVGITNPIYSLESGSLPDGLQLDSGGIIFGTPTKTGTFDFQLGVTEAGTGVTCVSDCELQIKGNCTVPTQQWSVVLDDPQYVGVAARTQNTPMILTANVGTDKLISIRMDNQGVNSNVVIFPGGDAPTGVSYCPTNDRLIVMGQQNIYGVNPDTLALLTTTGLIGVTSNTPAVFNSTNGLMYFAVNTAAQQLYVFAYDPITATNLGSSVVIDFAQMGPRVTVDETNKVLYLVRNNTLNGTARLCGFDISTNTPTLVLDAAIPTPGGDPSGVIGCLFCPTNKFVYILAAGQGGAALIRYNTQTASFVNSTPVNNSVQAVVMAFNPDSNVVFVPDVAVVRCVCATTDAEVGQVMTSSGDLTYQSSNKSVAWLNTDLNANITILDFL